ncbi:protein of unknown function (plasmid) [Rhodovastum atsumiense]|nr:protein of unknown function [Rhodovastum atsumiense]
MRHNQIVLMLITHATARNQEKPGFPFAYPAMGASPDSSHTVPLPHQGVALDRPRAIKPSDPVPFLGRVLCPRLDSGPSPGLLRRANCSLALA